MKTYVLICALIIRCNGMAEDQEWLNHMEEEVLLNFTGFAKKYGHVAEEHNLITPDGYILQLDRIVGDNRKPILLLHGAIEASDTFIIRGETSLAIILARKGYDVWALNTRGNRFSRRHLIRNADENKEFWDFSAHELGYYDVPLAIDFILLVTGQEKLNAIGYSEGTTIVYILGATRPEYNDKIKVFISLAPVCFMQNTKPFMSHVIENSPAIYKALMLSGNEEFTGYFSPFKRLWDGLCLQKGIGFQLCLLGALYQICGVDIEEIEEDFFPVIVGHFPAGTSTKSMYHIAQSSKRKIFAQFDYGPENNELVYGSKSPPKYDLQKVTMKVALFVGQNDRISTVEDTALLRSELPNVVRYHVIERPEFNHLDFTWGKTTHITLYPHVLETLEKYG